MPRTVRPSRHSSTGEISTPGEFDTAGEISTPEGDESPATRLPLRQLARLDLNAAADGAPPLSAEESRALEWAQQREAAAHEPSGARGGLLVASARVDALGVIAALVRDDACGGGRTLVVATAASLEAWEERLRAARCRSTSTSQRQRGARRSPSRRRPAASSSPRTECSSEGV